VPVAEHKEGPMVRTSIASALAALLLASAAPAQAPRLRWQPGQVLTYRVEQATQNVETKDDARAETTTRLALTKRWQVLDVDAAGVATVQLSLLALRLETTTPDGATSFDSAAPDKATPPALREQLGRYVGPPLAVLRVDGGGRVLEVKESKFGPASRYEAEPPFGGVLPAALPAVGQSWERPYRLTPADAPTPYDAVQRYVCKAVDANALTVTLTSELKAQPSAAELASLVQQLPTGEVVYDLRNGRYHGANLRIDREVKGHQGEGTACRYTSTYSEVFVGDH
jgi:hypothetical protein